MIEPTHGIKDQNGNWMQDEKGIVVNGTHRVMLATAEQLNRYAQNYGTGDSYICEPLPIAPASAEAVEFASARFYIR